MTSSNSSNGCRKIKRLRIRPPEISEPRRCCPTSKGKICKSTISSDVLEMRHRRRIVDNSCLMLSTRSRERLSEQYKILNSEPFSASASLCRIESSGKNFPPWLQNFKSEFAGPRKMQVRQLWSVPLPQHWPLSLPRNRSTSLAKMLCTN